MRPPRAAAQPDLAVPYVQDHGVEPPPDDHLRLAGRQGGEVAGAAARSLATLAWCELVPEELATASPGSVSFDVQEFAVFADPRRLVLHRDRGFSLSGGSDPWAFLTARSIEADVRTTVLPDEDTPDEHPDAWLAGLLHAHGSR